MNSSRNSWLPILRGEGFQVSLAGTGRELLATLDAENVGLVLLDLGLPDEDGLVLMRQIRARSGIPVIVLTARLDREDRISALELGADDYLTKPCDPEELVLRVQNLLTRSRSATSNGSGRRIQSAFCFNGWTMNINARSLTNVEGEDVHLSRTEFNLLAALTNAPNRVLSRSQLLDAISLHDESPTERMIDVVIARLRSKIEIEPKKPKIITTMVGIGYKLTTKVSKVYG